MGGTVATGAGEVGAVGVAEVEEVVGAVEAVEGAAVAERVGVGVEAQVEAVVALVGVVAAAVVEALGVESAAVVAAEVVPARGEALAMVRGSSSSVFRLRSYVSDFLNVGQLGVVVLARIEAAALDASESAALGAGESTLSRTASAAALHTFTLDSGASRCFFHDSTTVTPLSAPVAVSLADPSGGPVLARSSIVLPYPAIPSGSLSDLHLPSFSTNFVSNAVLQDAWC
ncbi:unnamed protein product [Closterium sp. NIES-65]|nr:unnamed protein product [Closterium sp. NIES-65]